MFFIFFIKNVLEEEGIFRFIMVDVVIVFCSGDNEVYKK